MDNQDPDGFTHGGTFCLVICLASGVIRHQTLMILFNQTHDLLSMQMSIAKVEFPIAV
jgi:hypothetical protein